MVEANARCDNAHKVRDYLNLISKEMGACRTSKSSGRLSAAADLHVSVTMHTLCKKGTDLFSTRKNDLVDEILAHMISMPLGPCNCRL